MSPALTVREALRAPEGSTVTVRGYVIVTGGTTFLAEMLAETYPPQPGGAVLALTGLDVAMLPATTSAGDTTWTNDQHSVTGRVEAGVLTVMAH
jgi:hypothetical protein